MGTVGGVLCNFATTNSFSHTHITHLLCAGHCLLSHFKYISLAPPKRFLANGKKVYCKCILKARYAVVKTNNKE